MKGSRGEVLVFMGIEGQYGVLRFGYCPGGMGVWTCGKEKGNGEKWDNGFEQAL